jgi:hypothetical protein
MPKPQVGSLKPQIVLLGHIERSGLVHVAFCALALAVAFGVCAGAQKGASAGLPSRTVTQWGSGPEFGATDPSMEQKRLRAINVERQKLLSADTEKLLKLVRALNEEVEKTHPDSLTPSQLRTVAEIEKLAHSVKEKMSYSYMGGPEFREPPHLPGSVR